MLGYCINITNDWLQLSLGNQIGTEAPQASEPCRWPRKRSNRHTVSSSWRHKAASCMTAPHPLFQILASMAQPRFGNQNNILRCDSGNSKSYLLPFKLSLSFFIRPQYATTISRAESFTEDTSSLVKKRLLDHFSRPLATITTVRSQLAKLKCERMHFLYNILDPWKGGGSPWQMVNRKKTRQSHSKM